MGRPGLAVQLWLGGCCVSAGGKIWGNKHQFSAVSSQQSVYGVRLNFYRGFWEWELWSSCINLSGAAQLASWSNF